MVWILHSVGRTHHEVRPGALRRGSPTWLVEKMIHHACRTSHARCLIAGQAGQHFVLSPTDFMATTLGPLVTDNAGYPDRLRHKSL